ncbi:MAG: tetratricopeptide repeat protein [Bryobacteraceae bacterium]
MKPISAAFFALPLIAYTADPAVEWRGLHGVGVAAYAAGQFSRALPLLERAAETARALPKPDARRARTWNDLGAVRYALGNHEAAVVAYRIALEEWLALPTGREQIHGRAATLNNWSVAERRLARYPEAERLAGHALALLAGNGLGPDGGVSGVQRTRVLQNLAEVARLRGDLDAATAALAHATAAGQVDPVAAGNLLLTRAALALEQGAPDAAGALAGRAIGTLRDAVGEDDPRTASARSTLAVALFRQGRLGEAETILRAVAAVYRAQPDPEPLAAVLNNLGLIRSARSDDAEAEPLLRRAIAIWEERLGPRHPNVARGLENLGDLFAAQGKSSGAEKLYRRALAIAAESGSAGLRDEIAAALTRLLETNGRTVEARRLRSLNSQSVRSQP